MAQAHPDREDLLSQCFARTSAGEQAAIGGSGLPHRTLTLLRLIDGATPLKVYAEHLKRYDVAALATELLTADLIAPADTPGRGRRNLGRWTLGTLLTGLRRDSAQATPDSAAPATPDAIRGSDPERDEDAAEDEDDLTIRFMTRYAPTLKDDAEIDQAFRPTPPKKDDR